MCDSARPVQARLVKSFAAEDLSLSLEEVETRLQQLLVLLPELGAGPRACNARMPASQRVPRVHHTFELRPEV